MSSNTNRRAGTWLIALVAGLAASGAALAADLPPAKGRLLVAARDLLDPNFTETVVLLLHYDQQGAMGLVINRPTDIAPAELLPEVDGLGDYPGRIYLGGPVALQQLLLLVRAAETPENAEHVFGNIQLSGSWELLTELVQDVPDPASLRLYAGHAGWAPGQLDHEIGRGDWHVLEAREELVFSDQPAGLWRELIPPEEPILTWNAAGAGPGGP